MKAERGPVATAFGYAIRQREPLLRFLDDGRLKPDNNAAERALRGSIAVGRKAWLFLRYWTGTRARLDARELELPIGHVTVPPPAAEM